MQFFSIPFFALVAFAFVSIKICNSVIKSRKSRTLTSNIILLVLSYVFIIYADYRFAVALALLTLSTWFFGRNKKTIGVGVVVSLASLCFFKYTNFFIESFAKIFGNDFNALNLIVPIGVSFYTFSAISYLVDIKRERIQSASVFDVALYLSFFPKLTSGPIQRSDDFFKQMSSDREIGVKSVSVGLQIFVFGLFKKIVLADRLSVFVNQVFETPKAFSSLTVLLGVIAYAFQIYFDFSGYSDMAIGVAKILGFNLPRNFNLPYMAHNVTELWKRWHISLSSWLQDYLYIPLGGNRKGKFRAYLNQILTMVLGGIWHGASWTYVLWGLLHGIALAVHKVWTNITKSTQKKCSKLGAVVSVFVTFIFVSFCWIFFRASSFSNAIDVITQIFSFQDGLSQPYFWLFVSLVVYVVAVFIAATKSRNSPKDMKKKNQSKIGGFYPVMDLSKFWSLVIFFVFIGLTIMLAYTGGSPFIYGAY